MIFNPLSPENNLNAVKYFLCFGVLFGHFGYLTGISLPDLFKYYGSIGGFFAISGFTIFAAYEKQDANAKRYFTRRIYKIYLPYFVVVLFCAVTLGIISELPITDYYLDIGFYKYLLANLSFCNFVCPHLPGVFTETTNLYNSVDGALWTMKVQFGCYALVPIIYAYIRRHPHKRGTILFSLIVVSYTLYVVFTILEGRYHYNIFYQLFIQTRLCTFFFIGAWLNLNLKTILRYKWIIICFTIAGIVIAREIHEYYLHIFPDACATILLCMIGNWGHFLSTHKCQSYLIYLTHYPIIQIMIYAGALTIVGPEMTLVLVSVISVISAVTISKLTALLHKPRTKQVEIGSVQKDFS